MRTAQADLDRYITQSQYCWFSHGMALIVGIILLGPCIRVINLNNNKTVKIKIEFPFKDQILLFQQISQRSAYANT